MSWRGSSLFVLVTFVVLCSVKVTSHAMNLTNSTNIAHQEYTRFLLANGVARTPPMGYWNFATFSNTLGLFYGILSNFLFTAVGTAGIIFNATFLNGLWRLLVPLSMLIYCVFFWFSLPWTLLLKKKKNGCLINNNHDLIWMALHVMKKWRSSILSFSFFFFLFIPIIIWYNANEVPLS